MLFLLGYVSSFHYFKLNFKSFVRVNLQFHQNFSKNFLIKLISKPSKSYYVSFKSLKLLSTQLGLSSLIISTPVGYLTHIDCINRKLGGKVICLLP